MSSRELVMRARYKPAVRIPGIQGVLIMTEDRFVFTPDDNSMPSAEITEGFRQIKNHHYSKEGSKQALLKLIYEKGGDYIFEFDKSSERDVCRDFVGRVRWKLHAMQSSVQDTKVSEKPAVTIHDEQLSTVKMQLRMKLLHENNELQKLHKRFVIGGVLTEAEFWATRKKGLAADANMTSKLRVGALLADVRSSPDGRINKVTFRLTPEIIHQIFSEKPAVHQAFLNFVPSKMTEKDFWTKYCKAEYFHATNNVVAAAAEAAEDEELAFFLKQYDILASEARRKVSGLLLDESQEKGTGDETKQVITAFSTRKRAERTKAEDFDAEEWELLKEENEQVEEVFYQVGCLGTLIKTFKASFLPFFDDLESYISPIWRFSLKVQAKFLSGVVPRRRK